MERLISMKETVGIVSLSRAKIYELIKAGNFVVPTQLTPCRIAFRESLLEKWIQERPFVTSPKGGINAKSK